MFMHPEDTQVNCVSSGGVTTRYTYDSRGNVTSSRTMNAENGTNNPTEESYIISHT